MTKRELIIGFSGVIIGMIFIIVFTYLTPSGAMLNARVNKSCKKAMDACDNNYYRGTPDWYSCYTLAEAMCTVAPTPEPPPA